LREKSNRPGGRKDALKRLWRSFQALWKKEYGEAKERAAHLIHLVKHRSEHRPDRKRLKEVLYQRLLFRDLNVIFLGLCPLAWMVSTAPKALMLGILITLTLVFSNALISLLCIILPGSVGPVCRVVVIAGFVAAFEIVLTLIFPAQSLELGSYIPLTAISCISLDLALDSTRAQGLHYLLADAVFTGLNLTLILLVIGLLRELLGAWTLFELPLPGGFKPLTIMQEPAGGFLALGAVTALIQALRGRGEGRRSR
jgi:electron transport complex protein RnfE